MSDYQPTVPGERAEQMRAWHDEAYAALLQDAAGEPRTFDYLGRTLVVPPHVQPIAFYSDLLGTAVLDEVRADDRVLDMGTGSGVNAVLAAGTSHDVVAVDVNPHAVEAARANAERNGVAERVRVARSDVFSAVEGRFDLVVFDPPFRWFAPRDWAEAAITDENYTALRTFFAQLRDHLTERGRALVFFGTTADIGFLESLMDRHGFAREIVAARAHDKDGEQVEYRTYRLTQR
ncbi:MAG TPA: methyltransferase [Nocardioidaceae bacterium]|jgi:release factor glutamine methyltransferase|nr:methyltransferase [Nocardioidaceae bacterium]